MPKIILELAQEEIDNLAKGESIAIEPKPEKEKKPFIEIGQKYYCLCSVGCNRLEWENSELDNEVLARDNVYLTEEEANKADNKRLASGTIRKFIRDNDLEFVPDWTNNTTKWQIIGWNYRDNSVKIGCFFDINDSRNSFFFKSRKDIQKVISNCDKELKILLK